MQHPGLAQGTVGHQLVEEGMDCPALIRLILGEIIVDRDDAARREIPRKMQQIARRILVGIHEEEADPATLEPGIDRIARRRVIGFADDDRHPVGDAVLREVPRQAAEDVVRGQIGVGSRWLPPTSIVASLPPGRQPAGDGDRAAAHIGPDLECGPPR